MPNFTATDIKRLRELTGAGMLDCKKALEESAGDFDRAVEILRVKGAKDVGKRQQRAANNGLVTAELVGTGVGVLLELNCETDFVAKTDGFRSLGTALARTVLAARPADVDDLLDAPLADNRDQPVRQAMEESGAALGEKLQISRFAFFDGGYVASYLHKTSPDLPPTVGVLVELTGDDAQVAKDVAQHIAAMAPRYVRRDEVPAEIVEAERRIAAETAREEGKPEQALPKIVEGRVNGFFKDAVLVEQPFVKDNKKTVGQVLDDAGVSVSRFARFKVGTA